MFYRGGRLPWQSLLRRACVPREEEPWVRGRVGGQDAQSHPQDPLAGGSSLGSRRPPAPHPRPPAACRAGSASPGHPVTRGRSFSGEVGSGSAAMADRLLEELEAEGLREPWQMRPRVTRWVEGLFPGVETLATETLQRWMEAEPAELLLLDTRTQAEFDVSHLPGALLVPPLGVGAPLPEAMGAWLRQECEGRRRQIVCYCTVGYRSSLMTRLLGASLSHRAAGPGPTASSKVYNLCGGLVKWATERRLMVDQQERPTSVVHPFSPTWAKLLEPEFRAPVPQVASSSPLASQHS